MQVRRSNFGTWESLGPPLPLGMFRLDFFYFIYELGLFLVSRPRGGDQSYFYFSGLYKYYKLFLPIVGYKGHNQLNKNTSAHITPQDPWQRPSIQERDFGIPSMQVKKLHFLWLFLRLHCILWEIIFDDHFDSTQRPRSITAGWNVTTKNSTDKFYKM